LDRRRVGESDTLYWTSKEEKLYSEGPRGESRAKVNCCALKDIAVNQKRRREVREKRNDDEMDLLGEERAFNCNVKESEGDYA